MADNNAHPILRLPILQSMHPLPQPLSACTPYCRHPILQPMHSTLQPLSACTAYRCLQMGGSIKGGGGVP